MDERKEMCPVCRNIGYVYFEDENGRTYSKPCKCTAVKEARKRLERSGLAKLFKSKTFDSFMTCGNRNC